MAELDLSGLNLQGLLSFAPTEDEKKKAMTYGLIGAGLGILSANAQNPRGAGFGGAVGGAMPGLQMYQQTLNQLPRERLQNVGLVASLQKLQKDMQAQDAWRRMYGGGTTQPESSGASPSTYAAFGASPPQAAPTTRGPSLEQIESMLPLDREGAKTALEFYKVRNPRSDKISEAIMMGLQPGTEAFNRYVGTQFTQQGAWNVGPEGVRLAPGYAEGQGTVKEAEERARARYDILPPGTLKDDQGRPIPSPTRFDYVQRYGAQPTPTPQPQSAPPGFPRVSPEQQSSRDAERLQLLYAERDSQRRAGRSDPALEREIADAERRSNVRTPQPGLPQPGQGMGLTPAQEAADRARAEAAARAGVERQFAGPETTKAVTSFALNLDNAIYQVGKLEKAPGLPNITGPLAGRTWNLSGEATDAQATLDTLKAQIGVQVLQAMREASKTGGAVGQVTEREWPILQNQLGALQQSQTTAEFRRNLADVKTTLGYMRQNVINAYESQYGALDYTPPPFGRRREDAPRALGGTVTAQDMRTRLRRLTPYSEQR